MPQLASFYLQAILRECLLGCVTDSSRAGFLTVSRGMREAMVPSQINIFKNIKYIRSCDTKLTDALNSIRRSFEGSWAPD